ncbi:DUF1858 domain-containing protein [bacterium]|nr:DUF1858 domain-containing protein [candidate division CSSED10-310 bacterium]
MWFWILLLIALQVWFIVSVTKLKNAATDLRFDIDSLKGQLRDGARRQDALADKLHSHLAEVRREKGLARFTADMTVAQALAAHAKAPEVFARFNLSGCSVCASGTDETLTQAAEGHGLELDRLLTELNTLE